MPEKVVGLVKFALAVLYADEELAAVGVWARVCHGHRAKRVLAHDGLIGKLVPRIAPTRAVRAAALDHKSGDYPVKCEAGVVPGPNLVHKVVDCHRSQLRIEVHDYRTLGGFDRHSIEGIVVDVDFRRFCHMDPWCHMPENRRYSRGAAKPANPFSTLVCMAHPTQSIGVIFVAAAVLLAACGDSGEGNIVLETSSTPAPTTEVSADDPPTDAAGSPDSTTSTSIATTEVEVVVDESTTTAPQAGQGTTLTDEARVSTLGLGPVFMGDTLEEVTEKIGVALDPDELGNEVCRYYAAPGGPPGVAFMVSFGRVSRVDISDPSTITTRSGAGIGSTKDEIVGLFGERIVVSPHPETDGEYLTFVPADDKDANLRIIFETNAEGVVTKYRTGQLPEVDYTPGCP